MRRGTTTKVQVRFHIDRQTHRRLNRELYYVRGEPIKEYTMSILIKTIFPVRQSHSSSVTQPVGHAVRQSHSPSDSGTRRRVHRKHLDSSNCKQHQTSGTYARRQERRNPHTQSQSEGTVRRYEYHSSYRRRQSQVNR